MYGEWSNERKRNGGVCEDARKGCSQGKNELVVHQGHLLPVSGYGQRTRQCVRGQEIVKVTGKTFHYSPPVWRYSSSAQSI